MSLLDTPLELLDRILPGRRFRRVTPDDPVARMVARTSARVRPGSGYRRRLRGHVVNQYVAVREGLAPPPAPRRAMGAIGRSVLYASVALAVSVTAVGAASGSALPGDPLYSVKRQIEELRVEIAPAWVRPTLLAMALDERLSEIEALARAGRWERVDAAVADAEADVARAQVGADPHQLDILAAHGDILAALLATAPDAARPGLERAIAASDKAADAIRHGSGNGSNGSANGGGNGSNGNGGGNGSNGNGASAQPSAPPGQTSQHSPKPTASPKATTTPRPTPSAPSPPGQPSSPRAEPSTGS